ENIQGFEFMEFTALPPLSIHGRIADANGNAVTGTATLTGAFNAVVETDQWGYFSFMNLPRGGDYTVKVSKPDSLYTFAPPSQAVTNLQELQFLNFEALPPLRINGFVADANYQGLPATVTLTGAVNATTQADQWGTFFFDKLPRGGDYTVTVTYPLYTFEPPTQSVRNIQSDQFFRFEALPPLRVDGGVRDENGVGVAGATVTLSGAVSRTATTDEWGTYHFEQLPRGGDYVVTPAHDLYNFTPASRTLPALNADQFVFFDAALRRFTLRGRAAFADGSPLANVNVFLDGPSQDGRMTDANGEYAFANLPVGRSYTVTAAREGYAFAPATYNVNDPRGDQTANFTGSHLTYTLSGRVTDTAGGAGLSGVSVTLGGSLTATAQTDAQGNYAFAGLPSEGNYTVGVSHPHFGFAPASRSFDNLLGSASGDFAGTRLNRRIGGRVADGSGAGLSGATVTLGGARTATTQTDVDGSYLFDSLPSGFNYTVTVSKTNYTFNPQARQF
ncbi:MAG TPA: carboxypeptidase regulatory-like domain-containing protein, partial [Pyrinomonadaceae bacterium]